MNSLHSALVKACGDVGVIPPDSLPAAGNWHALDVGGDAHGKGDGRVKLFLDGEGGIIHNWKSDKTQTFFANGNSTLTPEQRAIRHQAAESARIVADEEKRQEQSKAAEKARAIWDAASPAPNDQAYLVRKKIKPNGARIYRGDLVIGGMACDGAPLIPMRSDGEIQSLQFIGAEKRFLPGGRVKGCYFSIGNPKNAAALAICEGFATGASIHEATGLPVAVSFDAGNLEAVAKAMRAKFPDLPITLCADDDWKSANNPGYSKAKTAALSVGGKLAIPVFGNDRPDKATDFNDMAVAHGLDAVKQVIKGAQRVADAGVMVAQPEPLPALPDVLPFDYDYLPNGLRGYVKDISERMQCPPDFAAVAVLVMMATIIGRKVGIRPMRHNDWTVICNLWGAIVGNSGVMKSPTMNAGLAAIKQLQAWAFRDFENRTKEYSAQDEIAKLQKSVAKAEVKKKLSKDKTANVSDLLKPDAGFDAPILKRYMTNNASYEALGELLMENPNGLLVESDEIIGLLKQLDAGGQEVARSFYLTAADGDKPYTFDRIMRGKGLHIPALCLSIIGGIQPGVLAEYVRQATSGGAGADGLLQRFGLMVYPDISPNWKEVDRYPDSEARDHVGKIAERLDNLHPESIGAETDKYGGVPFLRFDETAQRLFSEWRAGLEVRLRSGEEHPAIVSHLSKYRKLIPTLALINHLCDDDQGGVTESALLRAIAYAEYLESHARRIYSYATRPDVDAAKTLLKKLATGKLPEKFKAREVYRAGWTGLETPAKAIGAIGLLQEYGHLSAEELDTGGRTTTQYRWIREVAA